MHANPLGVDGLDDATIRSVLTTTRRIALVGASANPDRPSNEVLGFLLARGYAVTPINPGLAGQSLYAQTVVAALDDATPLEMVELFRASDQVLAPVQDAIRLGARVVWMQLGVINQDAAALARAAGLIVVMGRCPMIEMARLGL
ncbi:MAG TPA: CoA-binding protein [Acidiphilium sp.]|nr:MAG: CoA-binding protein [Acidiphilium sp. 21-60-14]OYV92365.1 MAG: CoA-binding protein [Acidiphilium sp. 37-60-79]OZB40329.1 MAG: CoA-binding protein [Acidiphilium sp. 34-60-192]HQT88691.1 CoA-binding protein [Acidiphilium sp.]HQU24800.1 CoA-binding protein [Acidiphilium sp.]